MRIRREKVSVGPSRQVADFLAVSWHSSKVHCTCISLFAIQGFRLRFQLILMVVSIYIGVACFFKASFVLDEADLALKVRDQKAHVGRTLFIQRLEPQRDLYALMDKRNQLKHLCRCHMNAWMALRWVVLANLPYC